MKLHLYIARRFLRAFLLVLVVLGCVFILLDMVEQIGRFDSGSVGFLDLLRLTLMNMPEWMYRILPLTVILATLVLFLALARSSEMVVTRAAGRSALITLIAPAATVFVIGLLGVSVINPIAAATSKQYQVLAARYGGNTASILSISAEGLWLRQGDATGQTVINAKRTGADGTELFEVTFFSFTEGGLPRNRVEAESAKLQTGRWALRDAKVWSLSAGENPEMDAVRHRAFWVRSNLTPDQIEDSFGRPSSIAIWDLPAFVAQLEQAGFSARAHQVWMHMELALPLFLVAMVLVGAGFTMRHTRFGHTGLMVMLALVFGFGIYFIRNFAQVLGENGQIPVLVAAWTPPVAAILASLGILLHLEDG
ncbi:LPS export ABC transporter permease LptG [Aliiroseovarius subalbicans]|uniref:LPS export ABC transporter permease LptG n=1 Tax=Aliiroseovarius subalbicans TaxID=2925840 RepID=UPI001F5988DC|nr:LPS export ABC transporter permease LptG [Aliiroseovarius subalbicans]MCI2398163.1 LPS export ABC transporter permease LptG [Aliiroseovarius subalbicans]